MSRPLPSGDPTRLGPFRLSARLAERPAGIVFLGEDEAGRQVTVAVLTRGAAADAAARDRFRAAIVAARQWPDGGAPVVAAEPEGTAPWVATLYEPGESPGGGRAGAGRFLDAVVLTGALQDRWRGPGYSPYWSGSGRSPAVGAPPVETVPGGPVRSDRGLVAAVLTLAALLGVLAVLMLLLFACQPQVVAPPPDPPTDSYSPPSTPPPSPSPSPSGPSPSLSPSLEPSPSPDDSGEPGDPGGRLSNGFRVVVAARTMVR
jgi:hypothetical protein